MMVCQKKCWQTGFPSARDSTGRKAVVGVCHICNHQVAKKRRKTRKPCEICGKPVCNEHCITITQCASCADK